MSACNAHDREVGTKGGKGGKRSIKAVLCVSEERLAAAGAAATSRALVARVDPEADICYCEAKHVQSFYAGIARSESREFTQYQERDGFMGFWRRFLASRRNSSSATRGPCFRDAVQGGRQHAFMSFTVHVLRYIVAEQVLWECRFDGHLQLEMGFEL